MADVTHEFAREVLDRGENPAGVPIAFDAGESEFDLIERRGIGRDEMQLQLGMFGQKRRYPLGSRTLFLKLRAAPAGGWFPAP